MGLFDFLRRKDERAIPEPGSAEFDQAISGSAIPDGQSVEMGQSGWTSTASGSASGGGATTDRDGDPVPEEAAAMLRNMGIDPSKADVEVSEQRHEVDLRGTGAREEILKLMRDKGLDPDQPGQVDASKVSGLRDGIMAILKSQGVVISDGAPIPPAGGQGGWVGSEAAGDTTAQLEHLAKQLDEGRITLAEFEAQKRRLLDP